MEFERICGKRRSSKLLYVPSEKQLYIKKSTIRNKQYFVCYNPNCKARVELFENVCSKPTLLVDHNHSDNEALYLELKALNTIKSECVDAGRVLRDVNTINGIRNTFQAVCKNNEIGTKNINFHKIKRTLQKLTAKVFLTSPKSAIEVVETFNREHIWNNFGMSLNTDKQYPFFKAAITEDSFSFCIFASEKIINLMEENIPRANRNLLVDRTFSVLPIGCFNQLMVIYVEYNDKVFPFLFILLDNRSKKCYKALFTYLHENIVNLTCASLMTDYEASLRNAIRESFIAGEIYGCWFHFYQAIKRYIAIKNKYLARFLKSSKQASQAYHRLLALPLLPSMHIRTVYESIKESVSLFDVEGMFFNFFTYFENHWLQKVKPSVFSVFLRHTKTTSAMESYNDALVAIIRKNENFFRFVRSLQTEELSKCCDFESLIDCCGAHGAPKQKKCFYGERARKIESASIELLAGKITAMSFINRMVFPKNDICVEMEPFEDDFDDGGGVECDIGDDSAEPHTCSQINDECNNNYLCIKCCARRPNILLLPCKHLRLCSECCVKLNPDPDDFVRCPVCRAIVVDNFQVYN